MVLVRVINTSEMALAGPQEGTEPIVYHVHLQGMN